MKQSREYPPKTIEEAWTNLAFAVLLLAIEDVRKNRDPYKREQAKAWLLTPAAEFLFDAVTDIKFDLHKWVLNDCPMMDKK
jgi:hypothetical protein